MPARPVALGGRIDDRLPLTPFLTALQIPRALASSAPLTTDNYALLLAFSAIGNLGDRTANVLTKLYDTRVSGPGGGRHRDSVSRSRGRRHSPRAGPH